MSILTCIAKLTAKEQHKETVLLELTKLIVPSRREEGCINYDLHIDNNNNSVFMFHENWASELDLDKHLETNHIKQCFDIIGDMLDSSEVSRLNKISI